MVLQMAAEVLKLLVTAMTTADTLGPTAQQAVMDLLLPLLCVAAAGWVLSCLLLFSSIEMQSASGHSMAVILVIMVMKPMILNLSLAL